MKNTFGNTFSVTVFGESHGEAIGVVIDCPPPGLRLNFDLISKRLADRLSKPEISSSRRESECFKIMSGLFNGTTTGTPLTIVIENKDTDSSAYDDIKKYYRPSHADYTAECKYHGFEDYRGGGHFSGRLTAALSVAGAVAEQLLSKKGIYCGTHICKLKNIYDRTFNSITEDIAKLDSLDFPVLDDNIASDMISAILEAKAEGDSVGGILETVVTGLPTGIGEPWFDSVESMLSHILFSVPGIKGVEFGAGFSFSDMNGSEANDQITVIDEKVVTVSNNNGGINGGITNGMPVLFRCAVKPTPSISKPQKTVDRETKQETEITIKGRHDPAFIQKAAAVVTAVTEICFVDVLSSKLGIDYFTD